MKIYLPSTFKLTHNYLYVCVDYITFYRESVRLANQTPTKQATLSHLSVVHVCIVLYTSYKLCYG